MDNPEDKQSLSSINGQPGEFLWASPEVDNLRHSTKDYEKLHDDLNEIINRIEPDIVHISHFPEIGVEVFSIIANEFKIPIVATLHDYAVICHHDGRMVKTDMQLCYKGSPFYCHRCFSSISTGQFYLRKQYLLKHCEDVDKLIIPSPFMRHRYVEWGIPEEKLIHIPCLNMIELEDLDEPSTPHLFLNSEEKKKVVFGFFGCIDQFRGINILLSAIQFLEDEIKRKVKFIVFGEEAPGLPDHFLKTFKELLQKSGELVSYIGKYQKKDTIRLLRDVDWVIVPSIWWEAEPMVIEESLAAGTPVIASNIAGMKEKIQNGKNGYLFEAGSPQNLSSAISYVVNQDIGLSFKTFDVKETNNQRLKEHISLYQRLVSGSP